MMCKASQSRRVGLLTIGRSRPGFDPAWGQTVQAAINQVIEKSTWAWHRPAAVATDEASLRQGLDELRTAGCDGLVVIQPTMGDGRLVPTLAQLWGDPIVVWATTERQDTGRVSACTLVGTHVFASLLRQLNHPFEVVNGHPAESGTMTRLDLALRLTITHALMRRGRVGLVGTHAPGFLNMHVDPAMIRRQLGPVIHHVGMQEFIDAVRSVNDEAVSHERTSIDAMALPGGDAIDDSALDMTARYGAVIRQLIGDQQLDALALRCWPELPNVLGVWPYLAFAKLGDEGLTLAMEGDVDGALTLLMGRWMAFGVGYLSDWLEHDRRTLTLWHQGEAPLSRCDPSTIALGRHFNNDKPVVVDAELAVDRDITLARLWHCDGRYQLTAVEARTARPPHRLKGTCGLAVFDELNVHEWFDHICHEGMPHHLAMFVGHHADAWRRLARQLGIEWVQAK